MQLLTIERFFLAAYNESGFARHIRETNAQTDRQTDHATCDICSNRPHLRNACDAV